jgi:hypothetical protein
MTNDITRKAQTGEPTTNGGHFGSAAKTEAAAGLLAARNPALDGYPTELGEPQINVFIGGSDGDNFAVTIVVETPEGLQISAYNEVDEGNDEGLTATADITDGEYALDNETAMRVLDFAIAKQAQANKLLSTESDKAVARAKPGIIAQLTGQPVELADAELTALINANAQLMNAAARDMELASASLLARTVKRLHPDAAYVEPMIDYGDDDEYVSGTVVFNAAYECIATYGQSEEDVSEIDFQFYNDDVIDLTRNVGKGGRNSNWAAYLSDGGSGSEPKIDIDRASKWAPSV